MEIYTWITCRNIYIGFIVSKKKNLHKINLEIINYETIKLTSLVDHCANHATLLPLN